MLRLLFKIKSHLFFYLKWEDRRNHYTFPQKYIIPKSTYSPWLVDKEFQDVFTVCEPNTLVDTYRCYELWELTKSVQKLDGDILEVGVWRGGTAAIIAKACKSETRLYFCDTFEGVVKAGKRDNFYSGGEHSDTSPAVVESLLSRLKVENYQILVGVFPDITGDSIPTTTTFKLCHIDVDVYESAKCTFDWIWPRLCIGGIVIFDDYGFAACEGITVLVNELSLRDDVVKLHNLNGHGILIKIA